MEQRFVVMKFRRSFKVCRYGQAGKGMRVAGPGDQEAMRAKAGELAEADRKSNGGRIVRASADEIEVK